MSLFTPATPARQASLVQASNRRSAGLSLRAYLLLGILVPVLAFVLANAVSLYRQALQAANTAYDRTLLASAKSIGEQLEVAGASGPAQLQSTLPYSALEAFEADNRSRMFYKVTGFNGEMVSGFADLPPPRPAGTQRNVYAALVHFYDDSYRSEDVRMAVLLQPVAGTAGRGMATIQVAETLELRHTLARALLLQTLWQQALLVALIALVVVFVVQRATRPIRSLSDRLQTRVETDLSPLPTHDAPRELQPIIDATNGVMARLAQLLGNQKRFVRDASHQLRTPLAVLKTQVQSAQRGDVGAAQALAEIAVTVERATELANQMLALAKVEQLRQQGDQQVCDWSAIVRGVALDVSALIADGRLDFDISTVPAPVLGDAWALRELARNLLHNAIRHTPAGGRLAVTIEHGGAALGAGWLVLTISDSGPGIGDEQRQRLFTPFSPGAPGGHGGLGGRQEGGSGLGLAICHTIVVQLGGRIELINRQHAGRTTGLDARVCLPHVSPSDADNAAIPGSA